MALKQISPSQVELGMYIHSFQGNWLSHPFWRARFLVADDEKLQALRESALDSLVIDTDRGTDVAVRNDIPHPHMPVVRPAPRPAAGFGARHGQASAALSRPVRPAIPRAAQVSIGREFGNARRSIGEARKVISKVFIEARLGKAPRVAEVTPVVEDIHASIERNPHAFSGLMRCKTDMEAIYQHMLSVSALMVSLARQMGLAPHEIRLAGMAGLLLDIGVSNSEIDTAMRAGRLEEVNPELWQRHCFAGHDLLAAAEDVPKEILQVVLRHHEQMDGAGFPQKLNGREIDLYSRMAAICDKFDLIASGAISGEPADPAEAMRVMMQTESAFDPEILAHFQEALGVYPVGSCVLLRSGRIAMVVDQNASEPALPVVRTFHSAITDKTVAVKTIDLANCYGVDAITQIANLAELDLPPAEELRERLLTGKKRPGALSVTPVPESIPPDTDRSAGP